MNIKAVAGQIGMDYDSVFEDFCGDAAEISARLESFIDDCHFDELRDAITSSDLERIAKAAHNIRKRSEKLGITNLAKYASNLEKAKKDKIAKAFELLEKEYLKVEKALIAVYE